MRYVFQISTQVIFHVRIKPQCAALAVRRINENSYYYLLVLFPFLHHKQGIKAGAPVF